jgi:hypothetical protein
MDYENKFYEKFGNENFVFQDVIRDKKEKRTYLKIQCKKCNNIELKEQFDLFQKDNILCHKCEGRKKSDRLNIKDEIDKIESEFNIKVNHYNKSKNDIFIYYNCKKCNKETKKSLYEFTRKNQHLKFPEYCYSCSQNNRKWNNQLKTEDVKQWFIDRGVEPLFEEYKNSYSYLNLKCKCGEKFRMSFKNRFHHDENWIPKCQDCKDIERLTKFKYDYDRYDHRGKDRTWSKYIKKKFNNKCIISGKIENIVAHHLNGYNSYKEQKYDINNGVVITDQLHNEFHIKYDNFKGDCTKEQFEEFFYLKTNKKFNIKNYESKEITQN